VINSPVFKEITYQKASETFHQWSDNKYAYGLNFASNPEADGFCEQILAAVEKLKGRLPFLFDLIYLKIC